MSRTQTLLSLISLDLWNGNILSLECRKLRFGDNEKTDFSTKLWHVECHIRHTVYVLYKYNRESSLMIWIFLLFR